MIITIGQPTESTIHQINFRAKFSEMLAEMGAPPPLMERYTEKVLKESGITGKR